MSALTADVPPTLESLTQQLTAEVRPIEKTIVEVRLEQIREVATGVGARAAFARRSFEINQLLDKRAEQLDALYNFKPLMLGGNTLPPVVVEQQNTFVKGDAASARLIGRTYKIEQTPSIVSVQPSWRGYLMHRYPVPEMPHDSLLPKSDDELKMWQRWIKEGWKSGIEQADRVADSNMARLNRDFRGMILGRMLKEKGLLGDTVIASATTPVSGDSKTLFVEDTMLRITGMPEFNQNFKSWKETR